MGIFPVVGHFNEEAWLADQRKRLALKRETEGLFMCSDGGYRTENERYEFERACSVDRGLLAPVLMNRNPGKPKPLKTTPARPLRQAGYIVLMTLAVRVVIIVLKRALG